MGRFPQRVRPSETVADLLPASGAVFGNMYMSGRSLAIPFPILPEGDLRLGVNYSEWRQMGTILCEDMSAGPSDRMFIVRDGKLLGRGQGGSSMGDGGTEYRNDFVDLMAGLTQPPGPFTQVVAENGHAAALAGGLIYTWGSRGNGRLADGGTSGFRTRPAPVLNPTGETVTDWAFVAMGFQMGAGIRETGELYTWGNNVSGGTGLGITTTTSTTRPTKVGTDTDWVRVDVGERFMIALKSNGTLWGWGLSNRNGTGSAESTPAQIGSDDDWETFACGRNHTMAIKDGTVVSWGLNSFGRTGLNTTVGSNSTPTAVITDNFTGTPVDVGAYDQHSLLVTTDGVFGCGSNADSTWGGGSVSQSLVFVRVLGLPNGGATTEITVSGEPFTVHTFTSDGVLNVRNGGEVEYLVVGGGGGSGRGNNFGAGGGGGGGVVTGQITIASGPQQIVVGRGGAGIDDTEVPAENGGPSSAFGISAEGGGGGAGAFSATPGGDGGSGGGGSGISSVTNAGGSGVAGQGNDGGDGASGSGGGGGGGGATTAGGSANARGGDAGQGFESSITGTAKVYGAGGPGTGGTLGNNSGTPATGGSDFDEDGENGTGNGAGGGVANQFRDGGDGTVIVRYPTGTVEVEPSLDYASFKLMRGSCDRSGGAYVPRRV